MSFPGENRTIASMIKFYVLIWEKSMFGEDFERLILLNIEHMLSIGEYILP